VSLVVSYCNERHLRRDSCARNNCNEDDVMFVAVVVVDSRVEVLRICWLSTPESVNQLLLMSEISIGLITC